MLGHSPTRQAIHSAYRESQLDALIKQIPVTNEANASVMDQGAGLLTATTTWKVGYSGLECQREVFFDGMAAGYDVVAWPESSKINRMHGDSRGR